METFVPVRKASYRVQITHRFTGAPVAGCSFADLKVSGTWGRSLNLIAQAIIVVERPDDTCLTCECRVIERAHEIRIYRQGTIRPVFIGPIVVIDDDPGLSAVTYTAQDRSYWLRGAPWGEDVSWVNQDVSQVFQRFLVAAEEYANSGLVFGYRDDPDAVPPDSGILITGSAQEYDPIKPLMDEQIGTTVDFTVAGENFYWGAPKIEFPVGDCLDNSHWRGPFRGSNSQWVGSMPVLSTDYTSAPTRVVCIGARGARGVWPLEEVDLGHGLRTEWVYPTNMKSDQQCQDYAKETYDSSINPDSFILTGDGTLGPKFPIPVDELVPGRTFCVNIEGICSEAHTTLRLFNVSADFETVVKDGKNALQETRVAIDLAPLGAAAGHEESGF